MDLVLEPLFNGDSFHIPQAHVTAHEVGGLAFSAHLPGAVVGLAGAALPSSRLNRLLRGCHVVLVEQTGHELAFGSDARRVTAR
jgi:hypothetical protein